MNIIKSRMGPRQLRLAEQLAEEFKQFSEPWEGRGESLAVITMFLFEKLALIQEELERVNARLENLETE